MSQRKRDWITNARPRRGGRGGGGGSRFSRNDDFRPPQRGRGYGGRPPPFTGTRQENSPDSGGWSRGRRSDPVEPEPSPVIEPLQPPDLRFIDLDAAWAPFNDSTLDAERSPSPEGRLFANNTDPSVEILRDLPSADVETMSERNMVSSQYPWQTVQSGSNLSWLNRSNPEIVPNTSLIQSPSQLNVIKAVTSASSSPIVIPTRRLSPLNVSSSPSSTPLLAVVSPQTQNQQQQPQNIPQISVLNQQQLGHQTQTQSSSAEQSKTTNSIQLVENYQISSTAPQPVPQPVPAPVVESSNQFGGGKNKSSTASVVPGITPLNQASNGGKDKPGSETNNSQSEFKVPAAKVDNDSSKKSKVVSSVKVGSGGTSATQPLKFSIEKKVEEITNKLLKTMDVDRLKRLINNPDIKCENVLKSHATKRIRSKMQKQLRNFKLPENNENLLNPEECIDAEKIPESVFSEIDRVLDLNMFDNSESDSDVICLTDREDTDVLDQNLGLSTTEQPDKLINPDDIFLRAAILLTDYPLEPMLEPSSTDNSVVSTRNSTPVYEIDCSEKEEGEIDDEPDPKNAKEPISFVNVDDIPLVEIPLPETNPFSGTGQENLPNESPIKIKFSLNRKDNKLPKVAPPARTVNNPLYKEPKLIKIDLPSFLKNPSEKKKTPPPQPLSSKEVPQQQKQQQKSPVSEKRRSKSRTPSPDSMKLNAIRRKIRDLKETARQRENDNDVIMVEKVPIPRLKKTVEPEIRPSKEQRISPRPIRPKSPSDKPIDHEPRPKLDLKAKLLNLDAIKAGSIFSHQKSNKEPSRTEILKNYRHVRDKSKSNSNSPTMTPPSRESPPSLTPPRLPPVTLSPRTPPEEVPTTHTRRKKKKKRRNKSHNDRSPSPSPERSERPERSHHRKHSTPSPASDHVVPLSDNSNTQVIRLSPKLNIEVKVLSTDNQPELRTQTRTTPVNLQNDIENELPIVAVLARQNSAERSERSERSNTPETEKEQEVPIETGSPQIKSPETKSDILSRNRLQSEQFYNIIEMDDIGQEQAIQNIIDEVQNASPPEPEVVVQISQEGTESFEALAQGIFDEIAQLESDDGKQSDGQTYDSIAQSLINEVVQHNDMSSHFSPPQSMHQAYQSPVQHPFHSSPPSNVIHMSPVGQLQPSPAHSMHSMHSIYSPASCYQYTCQSPLQNQSPMHNHMSPMPHLASPSPNHHNNSPPMQQRSPVHHQSNVAPIQVPLLVQMQAAQTQSLLQNQQQSAQMQSRVVPPPQIQMISTNPQPQQQPQHQQQNILNQSISLSELPFIGNESQLVADDTLNLSPEQVQQVASLHNTPIHGDKQDGNLMDEIVRNLMENQETDLRTQIVTIQPFENCTTEPPTQPASFDHPASVVASSNPNLKDVHYTSPIRNDVFLHQPSVEQDHGGLQQLQTNQSQTEQMEIERFTPERLPETFTDMSYETSTRQTETSNNQYTYSQTEADHQHNTRMWRSPGEKKCIDIPTNGNNQPKTPQPADHEENVGHLPMTAFGAGPPQPSPRDNESSGDTRVNVQTLKRMKDIDIQMMALQKEKMSIDAMILKLQTEKMQLDQTTMQLQNERFMLLNSLIAAPTSTTTTAPTTTDQIVTDAPIDVQMSSFPTPATASNIIQRLNLPASTQKLLSLALPVVVEEKRDIKERERERERDREKEKDRSSKSSRHGGSSTKTKSRHKSRSRSRDRNRSKHSDRKEKDRERDKEKERKRDDRQEQKEQPRSKPETTIQLEQHQTPSRPKSVLDTPVTSKPDETKPQSTSSSITSSQPASEQRSSAVDPPVVADAPIKLTHPTKILTPAQKKPIEIPKRAPIVQPRVVFPPKQETPKITIALTPSTQKATIVRSNMQHHHHSSSQSELDIFGEQSSSQTTSTSTFQTAISAKPAGPVTGKRMKELKKERKKLQQQLFEDDKQQPQQSEVPPMIIKKVTPDQESITLKIADVKSLNANNSEDSNKSKRKRKSTAANVEASGEVQSKRRRKKNTSEPAEEEELDDVPKQRRRRNSSRERAVEVQVDPRKRPGKVMKLITPPIEKQYQPVKAESVIIDAEITIDDSSTDTPDMETYLKRMTPAIDNGATKQQVSDAESDDDDNNVQSSVDQYSIINKECKIVLQKIDMQKFLRKKPVDTKVESGLVVSLPNSPDKDSTGSPVSDEGGPPRLSPPNLLQQGLNLLEMSSPRSTEEDFEGVPESSLWDGTYHGHQSAIARLKIFGRYLVTAAENGHMYRFVWQTGQLEKVFREHTNVVTNFVMDNTDNIYSVSLDGFMKKFHIENFTTSTESIQIGDLLQTVEVQWNCAYAGSRNGRIHTYDTQTNKLIIPPLCEINKPIHTIKAHREGPRRVLLVGLKTSEVQVRDADDGLLLRSIFVPVSYTISTITLDRNLLYCGTTSNELISLDFSSSAIVDRKKCGNSILAVRTNDNFIFTGCYDGFIYVHRKSDGKLAGKIQGPGKMLLDFTLINNKIVGSAKDMSLKLWDLAPDLLSNREV